ncbi:hypothetical protein E4T66_17190 [Sinimarinibacterium sp. CAU 1509]|uniref:hypothetical protein n=1 Tax=Sinimarinibacterium sp. CAU 1509 TaxID=2562283 RepID=UPI0010AD9A6B|nr:hypothetical protein [Sinimarinibacterium sp. CAU 1509]TJY57146.1 hypothetical protein E4T66_17190 [Sinimarinibacterium sp. CAU 1509]
MIDNWPTLVRAIESAEATVSGLNLEIRELGAHRSAYGWDPLGRQSLHGLARSAFEVITEYARKTLCEGNDSVLSDSTAGEIIYDFLGRDATRAPDFSGYWHALEARYGNGVGARLARVSAAHSLRGELGLALEKNSWRQAPKMERGGVTFELCRRALEPRIRAVGYQVGYDASLVLTRIVKALGQLTDGRFPTDAHVEGLREGAIAGAAAPLRADIGGCRWTFTKNCTRVWMPLELALLVRESIESIVPSDTPLD